MALRFRIARFARAEDGAIMVMWALSLAVFFGLATLTFDIGRLGATQSELQSFADSVALAAAGELDGKADAITRARAAAATLISDSQTFANGAQALAGIGDYTLTFYRAIPASDLDPMNPADITSDPALAVYAEVVVQPRTVDMVFASVTAALIGTPEDVAPQVGASAVAGYTQEACDVSPLMFCLPDANYKAEQNIGDMIQLRSGGNSAAWGPGNFGFLDIGNADLGTTCANSGGNIERCLIAAELNITQCYSQRAVDLETGQRVGITDGFNVRFDMYRNPLSKTDTRFPAAPNVVKGIVPEPKNGTYPSCIGNNQEVTSPDTLPVPRDTCFGTNTCPQGRVGDGVYDKGPYMDTNHGNRDSVYTAMDDAHLFSNAYDSGVPGNLIGKGTRYETYLREIAHAAATGGPIVNGNPETGLPQCAVNNVSKTPERRVLIAAGIDCATYGIHGAQDDVPVEEFFKLFLTEPVGDDGLTPPTLDIWVEVIGSAGGDGYSSAGPGGIFRDVVQLYR